MRTNRVVSDGRLSEGLRKSTRRCLFLAMICLLAIGFAPSSVWGQSTQNAAINGKVADESGAAVPNVAITVTSPALQVPQVTGVSDADGNYKILDLPAPGVYRISFGLQGFQTFVRDGLNLTVGFNARVDAVMKVGTVNQTVEVTGESPVVDTVSTTGQTTLVQQQLQDTPRGLSLQELLPLAAGVSLGGKPDVGDSNMANRSAVITYGIPLEPSLIVEGINTTTAHDENTAVYLDSFSVSEAEFKTSGNNADVAFAGVAQVAVLKSGSNDFHGGARGSYENPSFQAKAPATAGNPLGSPGYYDYAVNMGGRIIRDKLWFFGATSKQSVRQGVVNTIALPDPAPGVSCKQNGWSLSTCPGAVPALTTISLPQYDFKFSYQLKPTIKLLATNMWARKFFSGIGSGANTPLPETSYQHQPGSAWKGEIQASPSSKLLIDALVGHGGYFVHYVTQPAANLAPFGHAVGSDFVGDPAQLDSAGLHTGPQPGPNDAPQNRYEANGSISIIPSASHLGGMHQLKVGTTLDWETAARNVPREELAGDYVLTFGNSGGFGVPILPSQITLYNWPFVGANKLHSQAGFITDTYSIKRVTINAGVRLERYNSFYPAQSYAGSAFYAGRVDATAKPGQTNLFPAQSYSSTQILTWKDVVPRIGGAWDVTGNGKTVIKASFGLFGDTMGDLFAGAYNPDLQNSNTYTWNTGQTNGACFPQTGVANAFLYDEFACDVNPAWFTTTLPGLSPTSTTGGITSIVNPALTEPKTYEFTAKLERQLVPNVALSVGWVGHRIYNQYDAATNPGATVGATTAANGNGINVGRPYANYTILRTAPQTGTGSDPGGTWNLYSYDTTAAGLANPAGGTYPVTETEVLSTPSNRPDVYNSFEVAVNKRYSKRWNASASFWETKNHRWINGLQGIAGSPNDNYFPIDDTWNWEARGNISYTLPKSITLASYFRAQSGIYGQRAEQWTSAQAGGLTQGTITAFTGPYGQFQGPVIEVWSFKAQKVFNIGEKMKLTPNFQLFNLLNSTAATSTTYLVGTNFNSVTGIVSQRVFRIAGEFSF